MLVWLTPFAIANETAPDAMAHAQYVQGNGLFQKGEYKAAAHWLALAAEQGYAPAQRDLAFLYQAGEGVTQSDAKALELWRLAAAQNDAEAMYHLGFMYFDAAEPDYDEIVSLWRKAAELGFKPAAHSLGSFYYNGYGGEPDYEAAILWFEKAYDLGLAAAGYDLGLIYMHGIGVMRDYDKGRAWLEKAAALNDINSKYILGLMYFKGEGVAADYAKARLYLEEIAAYEQADGMYYLGMLYGQGLGGETDYARALKCYESAAAQNNALAQFELGNMYYAGMGLKQKDLSRAYMWFSLAADEGLAEAQERVAAMERELESDELGQGQIALARAYFFGIGGNQNLVKAYSRLLIAREYNQNVDEMLSTLRGLTDSEQIIGEQMAREWLKVADERKP